MVKVMSDYIKRKEAHDAVMNTEPVYGMCKDGVASVAYQKTVDVIEAINAIPSADVAPVRHGRWIEGKLQMYRWGGEKIGEKSTWECSVCHDVGFWGYNYCPNCGAKMDR